METLGNYVLGRELGRGATAKVFSARREGSATPVALKVFHPGLWDRADLRRRAVSEVRTVLSLKHPNIVQVLEPLLENDPPAVALEFVDGPSLEELQARLPYILPEIAVQILVQVLAALEHAHGQGVVHRDLKPANILVCQGGSDAGRVLVSDFGLARMADVSRLTLSGTILGSPDYMSPEQARGEMATEVSDLFSAGSVLYFLVTGTRPFTRSSPLATLAAVSEARPEPVQNRNPKISAELARIIHRALARDPAARFASAREFREALEGYLAGLGLTPEIFSLALWMRSPTETAMGALKHIAQSLEARATARIAAGDWEKALQALSHLSVVAPESAAIARLMAKIDRGRARQRARKAAAMAAACAAGVAVVIMGAGILRSKRAPAQAVEAPVAAAPVQPSPIDSVSDQLKAIAAAPVRSAIATAPAPAPAPAKPRLGVVRFDVPEGVSIHWDGRAVSGNEVLKGQRTGSHRVLLEREGSLPIQRSVAVKAGEPTVIRVR